MSQENRDVFIFVEKLFWERERHLLNQSLAFIGAKVGPRYVFRGGHNLVPRVVRGPYTLSVSLEPLGVWVSSRPILRSDVCFEPVEGVRLCFGNYGKYNKSFVEFGSLLITKSLLEETDPPEDFMSFYNHYVYNGRMAYRFGNPEVFIGQFYSPSGSPAFVSFMKGPIPWLLWLDGELHSLLPRPMSGLS